MAIVVTGGAGFIGSHLVDTLMDRGGVEVVCWDDFNDYYEPRTKRKNILRQLGKEGFHLVEGSFTDQSLVDDIFHRFQVESIVHLGGYAGVNSSLARPALYTEVNVVGTVRLLAAAQKHGNPRFIFGSSSTVYGQGAIAPFREEASLGLPLSPYGATKQAAETQCELFHRIYGLPTTSLRFFNVYGPRLRPDLAMAVFVKAILSGAPLPLCGDGSVRRDFTFVSDVCDAIVKAIDTREALGEAINIGNDQPISILELIAIIEKCVGKKANIKNLPARSEDMPLTHANLEKARRLLAYEPRVSLVEGVTQFVRWFEQHLDDE